MPPPKPRPRRPVVAKAGLFFTILTPPSKSSCAAPVGPSG